MEVVTLSQDGSVQDNDIAMDGASDGNQLTVSPKSGFLGAFGGSLSGVIAGDALDLSWQGGHAFFRRSSVEAFEAAVNSLRSRGAVVIAARNAEAMARQREAAVQSVLSTARSVDSKLVALAAVTDRTKTYTSNMITRFADVAAQIHRKRTEQRILSLTTATGVAAMNAGVDAQGLMVKLNGLHIDLESVEGDVVSDVSDVRNTILDFAKGCGGIGGADDRARDACGALAGDKAKFNALTTDLRSTFNQAEQSYQDAANQ
jgi:hypothetical protein